MTTAPSSPPPYQSDYPATQTSGWAITSVIAAVVSWLGIYGLGGIIAVIAGHIAKSQIKSSGGRLTGDGLATIGLALGYLNIAISLLGICLLILIVAGVIGGAAICPFLIDGNSFNFQ